MLIQIKIKQHYNSKWYLHPELLVVMQQAAFAKFDHCTQKPQQLQAVKPLTHYL